MAEHLWTVLCGKRLTDPESQAISLIDVGEAMFVEGLDKQLEDAARQEKKGALINTSVLLVSWWHRADPSEEFLLARFSMASPDGSEMLVQDVNRQWEEGSIFQRLYINIPKIPVSAPGLHWFEVRQPKASTKGKTTRWTTVTRVPLLIDKA